MIEIHGEGPVPSEVMVVGEAPGADEERLGRPFVGAAGTELDRMLSEAGLHRSTCFVTNVARQRPPNNKMEAWFSRKPRADFVPMRDRFVHPAVADGMAHLLRELGLVKPNLIVALGNTAMWALTGKWGVNFWRGSELMVDWLGKPTKVIPAVHPASILRAWSFRAPAVEDLKRAARNRGPEPFAIPEWRFQLRPSLENVHTTLQFLLDKLDLGPLKLTFDVETRFGHIDCAGIAWSQEEAICIPFWHHGGEYWSLEQEASILWTMRMVLTHPNALVDGQNLLYDCQHTYRHWHFVPRVVQDTMVAHHVVYAEAARDDTNEKTGKKGKQGVGIRKSLDFIASLYSASYVQWKSQEHPDDDSHWRYNAEDCVRTREVAEGTLATVDRMGLRGPYNFQMQMFWPVLQAMQRGVRIDTEMRDRLNKELKDGIKEREKWVEEVLGHKLNPRSPKQMQALFFGDFAQRPILKRRADGRYTPTLDDDALTTLAMREPLLRPLVGTMLDTRTLGTLRSTFIQAPLDEDGRMRCSYNLCGTLTYRLSSSENAFGSGANLQNLPSAKSKVNVKLAKRGTNLEIPNIRSMFIPDPGYTFFDMDLDRADLQVVAWEADEPELKAMLREGADIHSENAKALGINREIAKTWVHGTNYGGSPATMAKQCGISIHQATQMQLRWFQVRPGIRRWHERTKNYLATRKYVENRFGYRWYIFGRVDSALPEALAWLPQSTVAILINRIWHAIYSQAPDIQVLMQVHDSLAGQFPTSQAATSLAQLKYLSRIEVPYDDPLVIPTGFKTSEVSWGACA